MTKLCDQYFMQLLNSIYIMFLLFELKTLIQLIDFIYYKKALRIIFFPSRKFQLGSSNSHLSDTLMIRTKIRSCRTKTYSRSSVFNSAYVWNYLESCQNNIEFYQLILILYKSQIINETFIIQSLFLCFIFVRNIY